MYELVEDGSTVPSSSDDDRRQKTIESSLNPQCSRFSARKRAHVSHGEEVSSEEPKWKVHCKMMQFIDDDVGEREEYLNRSK